MWTGPSKQDPDRSDAEHNGDPPRPEYEQQKEIEAPCREDARSIPCLDGGIGTDDIHLLPVDTERPQLQLSKSNQLRHLAAIGQCEPSLVTWTSLLRSSYDFSLFSTLASLRINRVFLSPNPRNIEVFRAVANHAELRHRIVEIIYDDARLLRSAEEAIHQAHYDDHDDWNNDVDLEWFRLARDENLRTLKARRFMDADFPHHNAMAQEVAAEMPLGESWVYYQSLVREDDNVIATGADIEALRYGPRRFPSLRMVTVTPATHGWLFSPLYKTPMIREFPYGFNYPIPRGWPTFGDADIPIEAKSWAIETEAVKWRGYRVVTRVLAEEREHHHVSELLIDSNQLYTGLNCHLFEQSCEEYTNLVSILQQPGFSHIHLSLLIRAQEGEDEDWSAFRSGLLRDSLAQAVDLKHISLATNLNPDSDAVLDYGVEPPLLRTIFPIDHWPHLQHFGLWNFIMKQVDLLAFLSALPPTLRSLDLGFLTIMDGHHRRLLSEMRSTLGWRGRPMQPRVSIVTAVAPVLRVGRAIWLEEEVNDFLYRDGKNPFEWPGWRVQDGTILCLMVWE
ncbi:hypothetical protein PT974_04944 [Cladobotryum mycophilum]|uniref:Uncharacterized protein n=1 Tax=Cladobotryum mycophilum TaxID=491253 RepID=A0ABR0SQT2_9HYPO